MKLRLQFFAEDRTNMVSLLDVGLLMGGLSSDIKELGDGYTTLSEDWGPNTESTQYINMKNASNKVKGYSLSINAEREFLSDEMQDVINDMLKKFPTGSKCETFYYRFFKTDLKSGAGECIKVPVTVCAASAGGEGGSTLTTSIQIAGNGDVEVGTITVGVDGSSGATTYTYAPPTP